MAIAPQLKGPWLKGEPFHLEAVIHQIGVRFYSPALVAFGLFHLPPLQDGAGAKGCFSFGVSSMQGWRENMEDGTAENETAKISNKKLLGTSASLLVTSALLVVTRSY